MLRPTTLSSSSSLGKVAVVIGRATSSPDLAVRGPCNLCRVRDGEQSCRGLKSCRRDHEHSRVRACIPACAQITKEATKPLAPVKRGVGHDETRGGSDISKGMRMEHNMKRTDMKPPVSTHEQTRAGGAVGRTTAEVVKVECHRVERK